METGTKMIIIGLVLLLCGAILPFLMVMEVLRSSLPLNFLAAASQISGLVVGFIGIAMYTARHRRRD